MKFKLSTLVWLTTFCAVIAASCGIVTSEREESLRVMREAQSLAAFAKAQAEKARIAVANSRQVMKRVKSRAKMFENLDEALPHLMWLGQPSWTSSSTDFKFQTSWHWRIYLPEFYEPLELCWSFQEIPKTGFPDQSVTKAHPLTVDVPQLDSTGNAIPSKWLGCAVIACRIAPTESSYFIDLDLERHQLDAFPFTTDFHGGSGVFGPKTETDWLKLSAAGNENYVEDYEFDREDCRPLLFGEPHVLVRIRGKRKVAGEFEVVDGPSPGFMLWIRPKAMTASTAD